MKVISPNIPAPGPDRLPTPFEWRDPATLPERPWLYGRHYMRRQVSVTVAPGGLGKSSQVIVEALAMATGRDLLGDWTKPGLKVWLYNLEDPADELDLRITGAMQRYEIDPGMIAGRLFRDSGRDRELCTAVSGPNGAEIVRPEIDALASEIDAMGIDVLIVDPFVSSHQVSENDNGAIDTVAKEWARLADHCNCAIELVHHTRKTNGAEASTEDARGGSALLAAARSGRALNRMTIEERDRAGIPADDVSTYFAVSRDKANLAPAGKRQWRRVEAEILANGESVGVVTPWKWPNDFDGVTVKDLLRVQQALDGKRLRFSDQAGDQWAGHEIAEVLGLDAGTDRKRVRRMIGEWLKSGALVKATKEGPQRKPVPILEVGEWATV